MIDVGGAEARRAPRAPRRGPWRWRPRTPSAPAASACPSSTRGSLSIASTLSPASGSPASGAGSAGVASRERATRRAERRRDEEHRALAGAGVEADRMVEHPAEALDDRQAEAQAPRHPGALIEPPEFLEHARAARSAGMPRPVSQTSMRSAFRTAPASDQHPPFSVYLMALETRFCSSRRISRRSVRIASSVGTNAKLQPLRAGQRLELDLQHAASGRRPERRRSPAGSRQRRDAKCPGARRESPRPPRATCRPCGRGRRVPRRRPAAPSESELA